jgi:hypothetical protein
MVKLVRALIAALSIVAGPALVGLVEAYLPAVRHHSDLSLRGSLDDDSDFQLRGSVR